MIPCSGVLAVRGETQVGGHVIMVQGALTFVMLDVVPPPDHFLKPASRKALKRSKVEAIAFFTISGVQCKRETIRSLA